MIAKDGPPPINYASLYEMFMASVEKFPDNKCLGRREGDGYSWLTYKATAELAAAVGSALTKVGLAPHGRVGVYGANSPEWMVAMQVGGGCRVLGGRAGVWCCWPGSMPLPACQPRCMPHLLPLPASAQGGPARQNRCL